MVMLGLGNDVVFWLLVCSGRSFEPLKIQSSDLGQMTSVFILAAQQGCVVCFFEFDAVLRSNDKVKLPPFTWGYLS